MVSEIIFFGEFNRISSLSVLENDAEFWKVFSWYDVKIRYLESHPKEAISTILIRSKIVLAAIKMIKIFSQLVLFSIPRCWNHIQRLVISLIIDSFPVFLIHFRSFWLNRVTRSRPDVSTVRVLSLSSFCPEFPEKRVQCLSATRILCPDFEK